MAQQDFRHDSIDADRAADDRQQLRDHLRAYADLINAIAAAKAEYERQYAK